MQCEGCKFGRKNRGMVISPDQVAFFCSRAARVKDEEVASILEPLLRRLAEKAECPHFSSWENEKDSYFALDLPCKVQAGRSR